MTGTHFLLLSLLLVAHYLGDFTPLATPAMRAAKNGEGPVGGIVAHAAVHGVLVLVALALVRVPWALAVGGAAVELVTHFGIDWSRMRIGLGRPHLRDPGRNAFWHLLGLDQLAHGIVLMGLAAWVA